MQAVEVATHARDLGAHVNYGAVLIGVTLNERMKQAADMVDRLMHVPVHSIKKQRILLSLTLAKALYGCEAAQLRKTR